MYRFLLLLWLFAPTWSVAVFGEEKSEQKTEPLKVTYQQLIRDPKSYHDIMVQIEDVAENGFTIEESTEKGVRWFCDLKKKGPPITIVGTGTPALKPTDKFRITGKFVYAEGTFVPYLLFAETKDGGKIERVK